MIRIRKINENSLSSDIDELWRLTFNTIRSINRRDYTPSQVAAWAPDHYDHQEWFDKMSGMEPFVAEINNVIVGFADLQTDGYIGHFFCHTDYQGKGVGKALMLSLMDQGKLASVQRYYSHVSITAKPFFEHFGFTTVKQQSVKVRGEVLTNFVMEKRASKE